MRTHDDGPDEDTAAADDHELLAGRLHNAFHTHFQSLWVIACYDMLCSSHSSEHCEPQTALPL